MTKQVAPNSGYQQSWTDTGRFIANEPTVISGAYGWMFALAVDDNGRLLVSSQNAAGGDVPFSSWTTVGSVAESRSRRGC